MGRPPKHTRSSQWKAFLSLAWVFLLRKNEVFNYSHGDLTRKSDEKGKFVGWALAISNNKNCVNKREARIVFFKTSEVPPIFHSCLNELVDGKITSPLSLPDPNTLISHLRSVLKVTDPRYDVVIHSFRHGRPEYLATVLNYSEAQIRKVGRWTTEKSRRVYQHS